GTGRPLTPVYSMLLDMDGDSLLDLVRSDGDANCANVKWYKNTGSGFSSTPLPLSVPRVAAPNAAYSPGTSILLSGTGSSEPFDAINTGLLAQGNSPGWHAECSLAGSYIAHISEDGCGIVDTHNMLVFNWSDRNNDGRADLVAQFYQGQQG